MAMLTDDDKKFILNAVLKQIAHMSDKEYQKRMWIKGAGPDFDEAVCQFFDIIDPVLEKHKNFNISDVNYKFLVKFRNAFKAFSDDNDFPEEFIESPEWKKIMEMAKEVLKAFNYSDHEDVL